MSDTVTATPSPESAPAPAAEAPAAATAEPTKQISAADIVDAEAKAGEVAEEPKKETPAKKVKKAPEIAKIKAKEAAIAERERIAAEKEARVEQFHKEVNKETFLKNPTKILSKYGITFQDLAEAMINEGEPEAPKTDAQIALERLAKLEKDREDERLEREKLAEENKQAYIDRVFTDYKNRIVEHVDANEEKYELVKLQQKHDLVFEIQEQYHLKHGKILDLDQACEIAEKYLVKTFEPVLKAKKFQRVEAPPTKGEATAKTLSSTLAAATSSNSATSRPLTREERLKAAAEKLQFN